MALTLDKKKNLPKLHPVTQETLNLFTQRVIEQEGENLKKIVLYGSVAREEANKDSDIDVLVILKKRTIDDLTLVCDISADVKWDMDFNGNAYLQPMIVAEEETHGLAYWELMQNIGRDGVTLYDAGE
jgi:predicted nucleotidyltransferase